MNYYELFPAFSLICLAALSSSSMRARGSKCLWRASSSSQASGSILRVSAQICWVCWI